MAVAIGGAGIWCMHFTGMGALKLTTSEGIIVSVRYDIGFTVLSLISAILCCFIALLIASRDKLYVRSKEERLDVLVEDASKQGVKITSKRSVMLLALTTGLFQLIVGGIVTALGVCVMHYVGMLSHRFDGRMEFIPGVVAASVIIAIIVGTIAYWILFRLLTMFPQWELLRLACALVMGVAVCAVHYTGMYGAVYYHVPGEYNQSDDDSSISSGVAQGIAMVLGVGLSWICTF